MAPDSIFLEMETKSYKCGDQIADQKQFIVQDPDGYLFRFCCESKNKAREGGEMKNKQDLLEIDLRIPKCSKYSRF